MSLDSVRRVPKTAPRRVKPKKTFDWESGRLFLEIAQRGSLRGAANALDLSVNALRQRLNVLERELDTTLFTRHVDGMRLTSEGERALDVLQRMEALSFELVRGSQMTGEISGEIKFAVSEGLGTFWIAPRLLGYQEQHPDVGIDLSCTMSPPNVLKMEADVSVQLVRPPAKDLKIVRLGRLHLIPFVARSYVEKYGQPKSDADLVRHRLIWLNTEQNTPLQKRLWAVHSKSVAVRNNVSSAHYLAIASGCGIGVLPTYAALDPDLIPLDLNLRATYDIWLVYHPDVARIARTRDFIAWLRDSLSPKNFPWFADEFIHPRDFPATTVRLPSSEAFVHFNGLRRALQVRSS